VSRENPLGQPSAWSLVSAGYETDSRAYLQQWSETAIKTLAPQAGEVALDVACGPGTASYLLAQKVARVDAIDFSDGMLAQLEARRRDGSVSPEHAARVHAQHMDGQSLSFSESTFDLALSMFGLMFFPKRQKGMREIHRVLRPGGRVALSSWAPFEKSPGMTLLFGALQAALPEPAAEPATTRSAKATSKDAATGAANAATASDSQDAIEGLDNPEIFIAEMRDAGFKDVQLQEVNHALKLPSAREAWMSLERGAVPVVLAMQQNSPEAWVPIRARAIAHLEAALSQWPASLNSLAYLVTARK